MCGWWCVCVCVCGHVCGLLRRAFAGACPQRYGSGGSASLRRTSSRGRVPSSISARSIPVRSDSTCTPPAPQAAAVDWWIAATAALSDTTRTRLLEHYAPEYDIYDQLRSAGGSWSVPSGYRPS